MLAAGPMDEGTFAEFAVLQDAIKQAELRNMSDKDLQKQKDALYAKGGVMSADDTAEADRLQGEMARRGIAADAEAAARGPMSKAQFDEMYAGAGEGGMLARMRAGVFANSMVGNGSEMPEWMYAATGENDEERFAREEYRARRAERAASGSGPDALGLTDAVKFEDVDRVNRGGGMQEANENFAILAASAKVAAEALALVKNNNVASITGTTGPGS
jgi:hypothetical protein